MEIPHEQLEPQRQRKRVVDKERKARVRENGQHGALGLPQQWRADQHSLTSSYTVQPANPGENPRTKWTKEAQEARPEYKD